MVATIIETREATLKSLEDKIQQQQTIGQHCYAEIGISLAEIKSQNLWDLQYPSFEEYCLKVWGFTANRANKLIKFGGFAERLAGSTELLTEGTNTTVPQIPISERHYRPLVRLPEDEQIEVWRKAVEELPEDTKISESYVAQKVKEHCDTKIKILLKEAPESVKKQIGGIAEPAKPLIDVIDLEDDTDETEVAEESPRSTNVPMGIVAKLGSMPNATTPYDFAMFHANGTTSIFVALDALMGQVKRGGRVVVFCDPLKSYEIVGAATSLNYSLEYSLVRPIEIDPVFDNSYLFPAGHEVILVFIHGVEPKNAKRDGLKILLSYCGNIPGTFLEESVRGVANIMIRAFVGINERVLLPAGGKHLVAAAVDAQCDTTYIVQDNDKLDWYQGEFGTPE